MPGIDPYIVVHEIKIYPIANPVRKKLRQVHPQKATAIKVEVEKLLKERIIYHVSLTEWVSNIIPMKKKQGTIRVLLQLQMFSQIFEILDPPLNFYLA